MKLLSGREYYEKYKHKSMWCHYDVPTHVKWCDGVVEKVDYKGSLKSIGEMYKPTEYEKGVYLVPATGSFYVFHDGLTFERADLNHWYGKEPFTGKFKKKFMFLYEEIKND